MNIVTFSNYIADKLSKNIYDNYEDIEVISFGLQGIISTLLNTMIGLIISFKLGLLNEFFIFNLYFIPIRLSHKSYHCKTLTGCIICSNIMLLLTTIIIKYGQMNVYMIVLMFVVCLNLNFYVSIEKNKILCQIAIVFFFISLLIDLKLCHSFNVALITNVILILWRNSHEKNEL